MSLFERHNAAMQKVVVDLTPGEVRLLISQHDAEKPSQAVMKIALNLLEENPLVETEYFAGDLLKSVLELPADFWANHQDEWKDVHGILARLENATETMNAAKVGFLRMK